MTSHALYYPNIHLPGENWVKANLLLFSDIHRIIPEGYEEKSSYLDEYVDRNLVVSANIYSYGCYKAQDYFLYYLKSELERRPNLVDLLAIKRIKNKDIFPTTVHAGKLGYEIGEFLIDNKFAHQRKDGFLELHPALGEALMSTIAIACGEESGLAVVTENGKVYSWLQTLDSKLALEALISDDYLLERGSLEIKQKKRLQSKATLALFLEADLSAIKPDNLVGLMDERDAIRDLKDKVAVLSRGIPEMTNLQMEDEYLTDMTSDIIQNWKSDCANLSNFWKRFFNMELAKNTDGFSQKLHSIVTAGALAGGAAAVTEAKLIAAGVGFGIGVVNYSARTWYSLVEAEKNSPYRYLSLCEKHGVVFMPQ